LFGFLVESFHIQKVSKTISNYFYERRSMQELLKASVLNFLIVKDKLNIFYSRVECLVC